jgi:hypothetical protein
LEWIDLAQGTDKWRVLVTAVKWANGLHDMREIFWVIKELLASRKGFCFMGLVLELIKYKILHFVSLYLVMILGKWPTWRTILFYVFISVLYMFRTTLYSSSGESIVSLFRVQFGKNLSDLHAKRSPTQSYIYQMLYWYNWFSWWWAWGFSKRVENGNKHRKELCVKLVIYQE